MPDASKARRMASVGPSTDGVMMWSVSELTPTATGSMPSGLNPSAVMCSWSPRICETPDPGEKRLRLKPSRSGAALAAQAQEKR